MKNKLRVGVIGAGSVVREIYQHLYFHSQYSEILEIAAVANPGAKQRDWFGDIAGLPANRRFASHRDMIAGTQLDAVHVNTPDHLHCAPTVDALNAGLDVVVAKPAASTIKDVHSMIEAADKAGRFLGVDFHKRDDPRIKEAEARFQSGRYGTFQAAVFYMLDKLLIADPNHSPRFFASADFAEKNSPVSFLTVHMADALMKIVNLVPVHVKASGYAHKLPSLRPQPVHGYDMVDTEIIFDTGATAHILTGWALPNTAWATTVQSGRVICSDGLLDLSLDAPGLRELHAEGMREVNPLFLNFEKQNLVTGYGISNPGRLFQQILAFQNGEMKAADRASAMSAMALGFYSTLVVEGAELSLAQGTKLPTGATLGVTVNLRELVARQLGASAVGQFKL